MSTARQIAFIGNYLPRQCGIATFTTDLCEAMATAYPETEFFSLAVNDRPAGYEYPARVRFELFQEDLKTYHSAADYLNLQNIDLVCLQHEFGIFGGPAGSYILTLLRGKCSAANSNGSAPPASSMERRRVSRCR